MSRILLQYVLPLLLPTLVFFGWLGLTRKAGETRPRPWPELQGGPWYWLVIAGFVLMAAGLAYLGLSHGGPPGILLCAAARRGRPRHPRSYESDWPLPLFQRPRGQELEL